MQTMQTTLVGLVAWSLFVVAPATGQETITQQTGPRYETATFAGGCFWCMEPPFDELPGVISTTSGYPGGRTKPTYEEASAGGTGHTEAVEILYDPAKISRSASITTSSPPAAHGGSRSSGEEQTGIDPAVHFR
jgi:peptide-methionine (S)-S-oxide reductase